MTGWYLHSELIVRLSPAFEPMKFNSALCFFLLGLGMVVDRTAARLLLNGVVLAIAALTLLEYILGVNIGIDNLFNRPFIVKRAAFPGRFAPNTAVAFVFSALAMSNSLPDESHSEMSMAQQA